MELARKYQGTPIVTDGPTLIDSALAGQILTECRFPDQRPVSPRHVDYLLELVSSGNWEERDQLTFARTPDGRLYLINGYHRLTMLRKWAKGPLLFDVRILDATGMDDVAQKYSRFDVSIRRRSEADILAANGIIKKFGVSRAMAKSIFTAVPLVCNHFRSIHAYALTPSARNLANRLLEADKYWAYGKQWQDFISGGSKYMQQRLRNSAITAVGLMSIKYQPGVAAEFWPAIASQQGLVKGDPRYALMCKIQLEDYTRNSSRLMGHDSYPPAAIHAALAWNAFFSKRNLQTIRDASRFYMSGTPWK